MKIKSKLFLRRNSLFRFGHQMNDFQTISTDPTTSTIPTSVTITIITTGFTNSPSHGRLPYQGIGYSKSH